MLTASARNWQGRSDQRANCRRIWSHAATTARLLGSNLDSGGPTCTCHRRDSKGAKFGRRHGVIFQTTPTIFADGTATGACESAAPGCPQ